MCLARMVKKFEFCRPFLRGTPILVLPNFVKFYLTLKISCIELKRFKSLNFGELVWGEIPIMAPPICVTFSLFLISTNSENLIHLALTV